MTSIPCFNFMKFFKLLLLLHSSISSPSFSLSQLVKVIFEFNDVNCFYRWVFSMSIILVSRVPLQSNMTIKHQLRHLAAAAAAHMIHDWNHTFTYSNGEWSVRSKLLEVNFISHSKTLSSNIQIRFRHVKKYLFQVHMFSIYRE